MSTNITDPTILMTTCIQESFGKIAGSLAGSIAAVAGVLVLGMVQQYILGHGTIAEKKVSNQLHRDHLELKQRSAGSSPNDTK